MMPTWPLTGASARTTYTGSKEALRMSECAAANPSSDSRITSCGWLISFFMCSHVQGLQIRNALHRQVPGLLDEVVLQAALLRRREDLRPVHRVLADRQSSASALTTATALSAAAPGPSTGLRG